MDARNANANPATIYLKDYQPPTFFINHVDLTFELGDPVTEVTARLEIRRNLDLPGQEEAPLFLNGEQLELLALELDEQPVPKEAYSLSEDGLTLQSVPDAFELTIRTAIRPAENTELSGLYRSSGNFCTQCEAEGFRRITYFLDRPDVLARYSTTVIGDQASCPVLLSNGNPVDAGELANGRHFVKWVDPHPKPSYLFALVAGDLAFIEDEFVTMKGRRVKLLIYVEAHNIDKCDHAMQSLKNAMQWDEEVYGREYDLNRYMIVAVDDFNMGAMENKGLNVFNSKYVLAKPDTATDTDYENIEGVIGHEYFHNWSGNRVTCRDWFQLSLKEGFTVFRDQEFSADMGSRGIKRIQDVNALRTHQFREDAGPLAHPVRPDSYVEINNFYTATVYNKGAEVVRMLRTLLGAEGFRKGTDLYFQRFDGQAVTTEDFVRSLEEANNVSFEQFRRWYSQAGTPQLDITRSYNPEAKTYALNVKQSCPATPGQPKKQPFHIPLALALLDDKGNELPVQLYGEQDAVTGTRVLNICADEETFVFQNIDREPVPSLLRGFSAPVKLEFDYQDNELAFLLAHDTDEFARWEAGQVLSRRVIFEVMSCQQAGASAELPQYFVNAFRALLSDAAGDKAFIAECLNLPSENYLAEFMQPVDPVAIHHARKWVRQALADQLQDVLESTYRANRVAYYEMTAEAAAQRALANRCLSYLVTLENQQVYSLALSQYREASNMTDAIAALGAVVNSHCPEAESCLADFYTRWQQDTLVVDKWFSLQATSDHPDTLARVKALTQHPAFSLKNPNKVYSLIRAFAAANPLHFHAESGEGYGFIAEQLAALDTINPLVAARVATAFTGLARFDEARQSMMRTALSDLKNNSRLSKDVAEIINKILI